MRYVCAASCSKWRGDFYRDKTDGGGIRAPRLTPANHRIGCRYISLPERAIMRYGHARDNIGAEKARKYISVYTYPRTCKREKRGIVHAVALTHTHTHIHIYRSFSFSLSPLLFLSLLLRMLLRVRFNSSLSRFFLYVQARLHGVHPSTFLREIRRLFHRPRSRYTRQRRPTDDVYISKCGGRAAPSTRKKICEV